MMKEQPQAYTLSEKLVSVLARFVGFVFLFSGVGKLFNFTGFVQTIVELAGISYSVSMAAALLVIALEFGGGILFIFRYRVPLLSKMFAVFVGILILVLAGAMVQRKEFVCNCFGVFQFGLTPFQQIIFDVLFFNLLILLALITSKPKIALSYVHFLVIAIIIGTEYMVIAPLEKFTHVKSDIDLAKVRSFLETNLHDTTTSTSRRLIAFLLRYPDFSCPPCFQSILALADALQRLAVDGGRPYILGIIQEDESISMNSPSRLLRWKEANGLNFPVLIAPDSIFRQMNGEKVQLSFRREAMCSASTRFLFRITNFALSCPTSSR